MNYEVRMVPLKEIFLDWSFNCRGKVYPGEVEALAEDIKKSGLQSPVILQPYTTKENSDYKFRCVAGHRRVTAFQVNKAAEIPAFIRPELSERDAHILNLKENLHRKDLNILQEAQALKPYLLWTEKQIAEEFNQSITWVSVRRILLSLPEEIQKAAAAGIVNQSHIRAMSRVRGVDQQLMLLRRIKEHIERGEKVKLPQPTRKISPTDLKHRSPQEIYACMEQISEVIGYCLATRMGAWCAGSISDVDLWLDIRAHCLSESIEFEAPPHLSRYL